MLNFAILGGRFGDAGVHRDTPEDTIGAQTSTFTDFWRILGPSWDPLWYNFCDFFVIRGAKLADGLTGPPFLMIWGGNTARIQWLYVPKPQ